MVRSYWLLPLLTWEVPNVCFRPIADIRGECDDDRMRFKARVKKLVRHKPVEPKPQ
jgi:hypothetical protein